MELGTGFPVRKSLLFVSPCEACEWEFEGEKGLNPQLRSSSGVFRSSCRFKISLQHIETNSLQVTSLHVTQCFPADLPLTFNDFHHLALESLMFFFPQYIVCFGFAYPADPPFAPLSPNKVGAL